MKKISLFKNGLYTLLIGVLLFSQSFSGFSYGVAPFRLVVDGKEITSEPRPTIENDRTLVPIRFALDQLGAEFDWYPKNANVETVTIEKDDVIVNLRIGSKLVSYEKDGKKHIVSDVAPKIIDDVTFVPIRLISNIFGVHVDWDNDTRSVIIDSSIPASAEPLYTMKIATVKDGQIINGKTILRSNLGDGNLINPKEIKYLLLDPETSIGKVVAQGSDLDGEYTWLPSVDDIGNKALVAAIYDTNGKIISADSVAVNMNVKPGIKLTGLKNGQVVDNNNKLTVSPDVNFVANYIEYTIINLDNGNVIPTTEKDPYGSFTWTPEVRHNGSYSIMATAYDKNGKSYESQVLEFKVNMSPRLSLTGVSAGMTINKPVTLNVSRNFDVAETQYILRDPKTGSEEILQKVGYGSYTWFPGPEYKGEKELLVRVRYLGSRTMDSSPVKVNLAASPILLLKGLGPKEIVTGEKSVTVDSNVDLNKVKYILTSNTGARKTVELNYDEEFKFAPQRSDAGNWKIYAEATYNNKTIKTEEISFRVYLDSFYGKRAVAENNEQFLSMAKELARESFLRTGLSGALQTSQTILETGWGKSVGVDKYTGQMSYNIFGIKGKGPAGSVTIRTWEVYNGVRFEVDDDFRAYNSVRESWNDYNKFLMEGHARYQIVRDVKYDGIQAAWAIRRAGYATDPEYPTKLIRIMEQYDLLELDKIDI